MGAKTKAIGFAILAAALYAINVPVSKLFLEDVPPTMMAAFLYLGAGAGLFVYSMACRMTEKKVLSEPLTKKELPYVAGMIVLDIAAPILLMCGITLTNSANVSLLNNFEIVATSLIALAVFKETISRRLWGAIFLVTISSIILGFEGADSFVFNRGSLLVLGACICWGFENNCTKMLSRKSSVEIVTIKGCFSGLGSLVIALLVGEKLPALKWIAAVCVLGFVAYGLSINFYIMAQKDLGAAKTSAFYSVAPFLGVGFSIFLVGERPGIRFFVALAIMVWSTVLMIEDTLAYEHKHVHTHEHRHGAVVHTHEHEHTHSHLQVHMMNHVTGGALHEHNRWLLPGHRHSHVK